MVYIVTIEESLGVFVDYYRGSLTKAELVYESLSGVGERVQLWQEREEKGFVKGFSPRVLLRSSE